MNAQRTTTLDSTNRLVYRTAREASFNVRMADVFHGFGDVIRKMIVMIIVMKVQIAQKENVGQVRITAIWNANHFGIIPFELLDIWKIVALILNSDF